MDANGILSHSRLVGADFPVGEQINVDPVQPLVWIPNQGLTLVNPWLGIQTK
jgi:hypothetical protein